MLSENGERGNRMAMSEWANLTMPQAIVIVAVVMAFAIIVTK